MSSQIPAQPKSGPSKSGATKPGPRPGAKPRPRPASAAAAKPTVAAPVSTEYTDADALDAAPAVEEWPPHEWRETTRSAGQRQALYVALAMLAMFGVLVAVNIWGARNG